MTRTTATADALTVAAAHAPTTAGREHPHGDRHSETPESDARALRREERISHVFRTLGRGLVAEYDPA